MGSRPVDQNDLDNVTEVLKNDMHMFQSKILKLVDNKMGTMITREGQMWPFFQKSGCFISKIRSPLCCKRNGNLVIGKSKDCNSSKENNVVSACVTP